MSGSVKQAVKEREFVARRMQVIQFNMQIAGMALGYLQNYMSEKSVPTVSDFDLWFDHLCQKIYGVAEEKKDG